MLKKMHTFLHFFFVVFAPNRPTFDFKSGSGDRQKTGFLGFRENPVFDRFRWSATPTTKNRSFWCHVLDTSKGSFGTIWLKKGVQKWSQNDPKRVILDTLFWTKSDGKKADFEVQKVTQKVSFLTLFGSLSGPPI